MKKTIIILAVISAISCKSKSSQKGGTSPAQPVVNRPTPESTAPQNSIDQSDQASPSYSPGSPNYSPVSSASSSEDVFLRRNDFVPFSATLLSQDDLKKVINNSDAFLNRKDEIFNVVLYDLISPCLNETFFNLPLSRTANSLDIKTEATLSNCITPITSGNRSIHLVEVKARIFFSLDPGDSESVKSVQAQTLKQFMDLSEMDHLLASRGVIKFVYNAKINVTYRLDDNPSSPLQTMEILRAQMDPNGGFCRVEKREQSTVWSSGCYFSYLRKGVGGVELAITLINQQNSALFNPALQQKPSRIKIIFNSWSGDMVFPTNDQQPNWTATDTKKVQLTGTYLFDDKNLY